ncbi:MAG: hypothetical protein WCX27_03175 [Candidatus Paceibacterota bacterium]|jgi:hypothetical protein
MKLLKNSKFWLSLSIIYLGIALSFTAYDLMGERIRSYEIGAVFGMVKDFVIPPKYPRLDKEEYDRRIYALAHSVASSTATTTSLWPVKTVYPKNGAILPFKRIIAYYGNFYSTGMGALGQYPEDEMLARLQKEVDAWNLADPETPAIPAIHYIAITAQEHPGDDGKYRARMPSEEIDKALSMAEKIDGIVILDLQIGQSTIEEELPLLEEYLKLPQVHLAIDPEFSMKNGRKPGIYVGTYDAKEINYCIDYLSNLVKENDLPPKIFIIHRYIQEMVTNYKLIKTVPEVQVVMDMDGWGPKENKLITYNKYIYKEPVQFTGFKLFYKNDLWKPSTAMMTPKEILELTPQPVYIQYQ